MKRSVSVILAVMFLLTMIPAAAATGTADDTMCLYLGGTPHSINVSKEYHDVGVTRGEDAIGMISSFMSDSASLSFDLYIFSKTADAASLGEFMLKECTAFGGTDLKSGTEFNGITIASFRSTVRYDGNEYSSVFYAYEYKDRYVVLNFYSSSEEDLAAAEDIMHTLNRVEVDQIPLGLSVYGLTIPADLSSLDLADEDLTHGMVGHYSGSSGLELKIYQTGSSNGMDLDKAAAYYTALDSGFNLKTGQRINGIPVAEYYVSDRLNGQVPLSRCFLLEDPSGGFIRLVFGLGSTACEMECDGIILSLDLYDHSLDPSVEKQPLQLGASAYTVSLPDCYITDDFSRGDLLEEGLIATYYSPVSSLSFDVYECNKAVEGFDSMDAFVASDCERFNGWNLILGYRLSNGIVLDTYEAEETYDGVAYYCITYTLESADDYLQLCFYSPKPSTAIVTEICSIVSSLTPLERKVLTIGDTGYSVLLPALYNGTQTDLGIPDIKMTSYSAGNATLNFSLFELTNAVRLLSLEEYAVSEAHSYQLGPDDIVYETINGIDLAWFYYRPVYAGDVSTMIYIVKNGDEGFIRFDFVVRNFIEAYQAQDIMQSLTRAV